MVDDYREAYWWLRDHTPEDARVMAWWDYGYQVLVIHRTRHTQASTYLSLLSHPLRSFPRPDHRHWRTDYDRRRQHVEPRAHRHAWSHTFGLGTKGALDRSPPCRLRARLGGRRRRRPR
eukprot:scaffold173633_cov27-Tisochrysis_lutea.AAC.2